MRRGHASKIERSSPGWPRKLRKSHVFGAIPGLRSLVLASGHVSLLGPSKYPWIRVFRCWFSSNSRQCL